ncbi:hypothetical protein B0H14DRAFT_3450032 [Mycena olivaceomarginata]|nr:hypothetical protein B0H14DRAFT_3450032 [Mycena olivaceomarginata]
MHNLLMTAPLVNKTWQSTLTPSMQRALFFEPDPSSERTQNPLLAETTRPSTHCPGPRPPEAFKRPEASWRHMLVAQPPMRTMWITERCHGQICDSKQHLDVDNLSLHMGYLHDLTLPLIDHIASSFCMHGNHYAKDSDREADRKLGDIWISDMPRAQWPED